MAIWQDNMITSLLILNFLFIFAISQSSSYPTVLSRLSEPRSRSNPILKMWMSRDIYNKVIQKYFYKCRRRFPTKKKKKSKDKVATRILMYTNFITCTFFRQFIFSSENLERLVHATCSHQECLQYKQIYSYLGLPTHKNPMDLGWVNV